MLAYRVKLEQKLASQAFAALQKSLQPGRSEKQTGEGLSLEMVRSEHRFEVTVQSSVTSAVYPLRL